MHRKNFGELLVSYNIHINERYDKQSAAFNFLNPIMYFLRQQYVLYEYMGPFRA